MTETYVTALSVEDLFADPDYQRELDVPRCRRMADDWQPRLVGVLDVSDRGVDALPRYAIVNGQHRWEAARFADVSALACTVHTGLCVQDEAQLFWDFDRQTKKLSTWDRWYARRSAKDPIVVAIDDAAAERGLVVRNGPAPESLQCCAALEWVYTDCSPETVGAVLDLMLRVWPGDTAARTATIVKGLGAFLKAYGDAADDDRLARSLATLTPTQAVARAHELKGRGYTAGVSKLVSLVVFQAYNRVAHREHAKAL